MNTMSPRALWKDYRDAAVRIAERDPCEPGRRPTLSRQSMAEMSDHFMHHPWLTITDWPVSLSMRLA